MDDTELLQKYTDGFKAAKENCRTIWDKRVYHLSLYLGTVTKKLKSESNYFVGYTGTLLDNVWPILTNKFPEAQVSGRNDRDRQAAELMNELLDYTFDINNFDLSFILGVKEEMQMADMWFKSIWDYKDAKTDHPKIELLNTNDVYPHPRKLSLDDSWPLYQRAEMTKDEMIEMGWNKDAINSLGGSKLETESYRNKQLKILGYSIDNNEQDKKDDLYEVVETWVTKTTDGVKKVYCYVIANGEKFVNTDPIFGLQPFEHYATMVPFAHASYNPIAHSLLGQSFIDPIASQQEELNKLENEKVNNIRRRNNPPLKVRRSGNVDLSKLKFLNAMPWLMESQEDVQMMMVENLAESIESQQNMIRAQMQARTGANDVLLVTDSANVKGGNTLGGAEIANENTKMHFRPQVKLIDLCIERIGNICISYYQDKRLFDHEKAVAIADEEGNYSEQVIKPEMISGDLQFKVLSMSSLAESNSVKMTKYVNLKELYLNDPSINQDEIDKKIFEAADMDINKVKKTKEAMSGELLMKLKGLIGITRRPGFESMPQAQRQAILDQIDKIKSILQSQQGGQVDQSGTPPTAPPTATPTGQPMPQEMIK